MWVKASFGLCLCIFLLPGSSADGHCSDILDTDDSARYPKKPLTLEELDKLVLGGGRMSRNYYEVYSMDPTALKPFGLPILRKVAIRWNLASEGPYLNDYTNDYTGWNQYNNTHPCELGFVEFESIWRPDRTLSFRFFSVYPTPQVMIGTSFSSCPESYLINWYCPEDKITYTKKGSGIKGCIDGARMSIYSANGPNNMPWHLIIDDLCTNGSPRMNDKRWTMTYDAPQQCELNSGGRKKREAYSEIRHYL